MYLYIYIHTHSSSIIISSTRTALIFNKKTRTKTQNCHLDDHPFAHSSGSANVCVRVHDRARDEACSGERD